MKTFTLLILVFFFLYSSAIAEEAEYHSGRIIVKFAPGSELQRQWLESGKSCAFDQFEALLGVHSSRPYLSENILKGLASRIQSKENRKAGNRSLSLESFSGLMRICIIRYDSGAEPVMAARKIASHPDLEYAEPMPVQYIVSMPDDPHLIQQYYLSNIRIYEAWDALETSDTVVVGIVDTGIDYEHEDLAENIFTNPGETGEDSQGNNKRENGIDDDGNGFVDDWRGWDFVSGSGDSLGQDNDPYPGNRHGTHVAGTVGAVIDNGVGIAGIAKNVKLMAVKIGYDNPMSRSTYNSYEGVLYAAIAGADIINCSWGQNARSDAEEEIVDAVYELGSAIVAAAGNDYQETLLYPAAYPNVLSVVAVDEFDEKASFSNFDFDADVSAPGVNIYATVPDNEYDSMDGTSMASPVAAAVVALAWLKFPDYTPLQVLEQVKATCDNIDSLNSRYVEKLGRGRVNAHKAMITGNAKSVIFENIIIEDNDNDGVYDKGDIVEIDFSLINMLSSLENLKVSLQGVSQYVPEIENDVFSIGNMASLETKELPEKFRIIIPDDIPLDYAMKLKISALDDEGIVSYKSVTLNINPSYRTLNANDISVTFNSTGNIAFNDYPDNTQGDGFRYLGGGNILYEGALMVGVSDKKLSNVARGVYDHYKDNGFSLDRIIRLDENPDIGILRGETGFKDKPFDTLSAGVYVIENAYQFGGADKSDFVIVTYDIINRSDEYHDSLFAGLYFDWDIGPAGSNNQVKFDESKQFGYTENVKIDSLPLAGVALLSGQPLNFFAIDNDGTTDSNPGVWDGFDREEKWRMLSGGIARKQSNITDASIVIGAGPIKMRPGDTTRVAFSLFAGNSLDDLRTAAESSREAAKNNGLGTAGYESVPTSIAMEPVYPNPVVEDILNVDFKIPETTVVSIELYDMIGRKAGQLISSEQHGPDHYTRTFNLSHLGIGKYFLRFITPEKVITKSFILLR